MISGVGMVNKIRKSKQNNSKITPEMWLEYFKDLYNRTSSDCFNKEHESNVKEEMELRHSHERFVEALDREITIAEITKHVSHLKSSKPPVQMAFVTKW